MSEHGDAGVASPDVAALRAAFDLGGAGPENQGVGVKSGFGQERRNVLGVELAVRVDGGGVGGVEGCGPGEAGSERGGLAAVAFVRDDVKIGEVEWCQAGKGVVGGTIVHDDHGETERMSANGDVAHGGGVIEGGDDDRSEQGCLA